jgi:hypothetical protein
MVTTNGNDRHLSSGGGPGKDTVVPEIPRGLACDGLQPGSDGQALVMTAAMASDPPAFVNRMVRRWISRQAFGTERFSVPAE